MNLWGYLSGQLSSSNQVVLMCVIASHGSSPGRQGFKMAVSTDGTMSGSIGGGIMEHKLVELSRSLLKEGSFAPFIKHQVHQDGVSNKSGMICSGEQTISFYYLEEKDLDWVNEVQHAVDQNLTGLFKLGKQGVIIDVPSNPDSQHKVTIVDEKNWHYSEQLGNKHRLYILGGGHVGLALSSLMKDLGFYVIVIDDRTALNTLVNNDYAHETMVANYQEIAKHVPEGSSNYVVIVSFGYKTDKVILKELLHKNYSYLGMMGSKEKVKTLLDELKTEGFSEEVLKKVHTPIGLPINSKTPMEIAVSIAAQIIGIKNR